MELTSLIGEDEEAAYFAPRSKFPEKDVWIAWLGRPSQLATDRFHTMLTQARKRLIVRFSCSEGNLDKWHDIIRDTGLPTFESLDERTVILYKDYEDATRSSLKHAIN